MFQSYFHIRLWSIRAINITGGPAHGIVTKTVHKTLPGGGRGEGGMGVLGWGLQGWWGSRGWWG